MFGMQRTLGFMLVGLFSTLALSWLVVVLLDRPLEKRFKRRR
jgi:peptidoglycan/LPS O-acetylase OafA/YrhL